MNENLIDQINSLPFTDKEYLLDYLITDLAKDQNKFALTDAQKKELDDAWQEYLDDPSTAVSWEEAQKEMFKRP